MTLHILAKLFHNNGPVYPSRGEQKVSGLGLGIQVSVLSILIIHMQSQVDIKYPITNTVIGRIYEFKPWKEDRIYV